MHQLHPDLRRLIRVYLLVGCLWLVASVVAMFCAQVLSDPLLRTRFHLEIGNESKARLLGWCLWGTMGLCLVGAWSFIVRSQLWFRRASWVFDHTRPVSMTIACQLNAESGRIISWRT